MPDQRTDRERMSSSVSDNRKGHLGFNRDHHDENRLRAFLLRGTGWFSSLVAQV